MTQLDDLGSCFSFHCYTLKDTFEMMTTMSRHFVATQLPLLVSETSVIDTIPFVYMHDFLVTMEILST